MSMNCDIILQSSATTEQLHALGAALWNWCCHADGNAGIYQHLNNQALADLVSGKLPISENYNVHFGVRDEGSYDRQTTIRRLRRQIPVAAVKDILVGGSSWNN